LSGLLDVLDDFDRAKVNADSDDSEEYYSEGVSMVYNKLYSKLSGLGLKPMQSTNEEFDPDLHEAITKIPAPTDELKGKVVDTIEKGYYLNDTIIRHAKVVVGE
jgi:molecular chaperone GrpE